VDHAHSAVAVTVGLEFRLRLDGLALDNNAATLHLIRKI
jgi:hypothetical protein